MNKTKVKLFNSKEEIESIANLIANDPRNTIISKTINIGYPMIECKIHSEAPTGQEELIVVMEFSIRNFVGYQYNHYKKYFHKNAVKDDVIQAIDCLSKEIIEWVMKDDIKESLKIVDNLYVELEY